MAGHGSPFEKMIVPEAANMPPTPWQPEILAPGIWAGAMPRIWRTLSCSAYTPTKRRFSVSQDQLTFRVDFPIGQAETSTHFG
jgi:hypothetical protein